MKLLLLAYLCCFSAFSNEVQTKKFQKILAFYKDEQYELAEKNVKEYFHSFSSSSYHGALQQMLLCFYMKKGEIEGALSFIETIPSLEEAPSLYLQYLDLLCQTKSFEKLLFALEKVENSRQFQESKDDLTFYKAVALFDLAQNRSSDAKRDLYLKIKSLIKQPVKESFLATCDRMLFEIEVFFENDTEASAIAGKIAQVDSKFLFYEAYYLLKIKPQEAVEKLLQLIATEHSMREQAAFLVVQKLTENKEYDYICSLYDQLSCYFTNPAVEMMFCKALIETERLEQARTHLLFAVDRKLDDYSLHFVLQQLLKVTFHLNDIELFQSSLQKYIEHFPKDEKIPLFEYHLALLFKSTEQIEKAVDQLNKLDQKGSDLSENILTQLIELHLKLEHFSQAYQSSKKLLSLRLDESSLNFFLYSINHLTDTSLALLELNLLQMRLPSDHSYQSQILFLIAQKAADLGKSQLAEFHLEKLLRIGSSEQKARAHFLLGLISANPIVGTHHLEMALTEQLKVKEQKAVWVRLFNLYNCLSMNDQTLPEGHVCFLQDPKRRAAHYLYLIFCEEPTVMKSEHVLYLVNANFDQLVELSAHPEVKNRLSMTPPFLHLTHLFGEVRDWNFSEEEKILIDRKRGELMGLAGSYQEKIEILSGLLEQVEPVELSEVYFEIGSSYQKLGLMEKAKDAFFNGKKHSGFSSDRCKLRWVQLHKQREEMREKNLNMLKEIVLNKSIEQEPLFLVSALEYIDISLAKASEKCEKQELFLINRFIDDFSNKEDPFAANYHEQKALLVEKNKIWEAFILYAQCRSAFLKAKIDGKLERLEKLLEEIKEKKEELSEADEFLCEKINLLFLDCFSQVKQEKGESLP